MSEVDLNVSVRGVSVEYGVNSKIDISVNGIEIDDITNEVGAFHLMESIDNDDIVKYLEDEGFTVSEDEGFTVSED